MRWCCNAFKGSFEMAGSRGFGVFVSIERDAQPAFIIQHRSFEPGASVPHTDWPLSLFADLQIHFCPWCGVDLKKFYRDSYQNLDRSVLRVVQN